MVKSRNIQADILDILADGKIHTSREIAESIEVSQITVKRHIQALAYRHNIHTFNGGDKKGGIQLISKKSVDVDYLSCDELQLIIEQLELLQNSDVNIKRFVNSLRQIS